MRLSLRTLLAFEDNIFDVEQHRRLESILPTDKDAEVTLQRIRSVVRNPNLGVPGLVDHQEELDPNYVAEYLDHQMPSSVQEKFETYCLSADKYLAEIASIHHILSNVLGEPARTSRECRLKCYDALEKKQPMPETQAPASSALETLKHFHPYEPSQELVPVKSTAIVPFWKRWFPAKPVQQKPAPVEQKPTSSLWTFTVFGLCIGILWLCWQQNEKKHIAQQTHATPETEMVAESAAVTPVDVPAFRFLTQWEQPQWTPAPEEFAPVGQVAFSAEAADPFAVVVNVEPPKVDITNEVKAESINVDNTVIDSAETQVTSKNSEDSIIAFQPITSSAKIPLGVPVRQNPRPPLPATVWQSNEETAKNESATSSIPFATVQHPAPNPSPLPPPITQVSGTTPRALGRAVPTPQPSLIFSATSLRAPWQLLPLPFDLSGEQYLLTAAPFRGTFELADAFRIEMLFDSKLCVLPPDATGVPGIFVDYGRIIINPLQANQSLRIETEKSRGIVTVPGTNSLLFIDTFAEIADPPGNVRPPEEKKKTSPIIGFLPKNGEQIVWKSLNQPQPFVVETQGSLLLHSDQYRLGEIRNLPNWFAQMPMSPEDRMLAEACRKSFVDARGDGEKALTWMVQSESIAVRALGHRLWGDLGRFDVPATVVIEKRPEDEAIRRVLVQYFDQVMRRDAETIQRFADAIEVIKEAKR